MTHATSPSVLNPGLHLWMLKCSPDEDPKYLLAGGLSPSAGHNQHSICCLSESFQHYCNWTSSSTASFHLFIAVTREFPYRPVLSIRLGAFLVITLRCYPRSNRKTSCGFRSFAGVVDIFGGWKCVNSHWLVWPFSASYDHQKAEMQQGIQNNAFLMLPCLVSLWIKLHWLLTGCSVPYFVFQKEHAFDSDVESHRFRSLPEMSNRSANDLNNLEVIL